MKIRIHPYTPEHVPQVQAMNARIKAGGNSWAFYDSARPGWIPADSGGDLPSRRYYLAIGDDGAVHGGYSLKEQRFRIGPHVHCLATWQGPVSEGLVDRRFRKVGLHCLMDMADRNPLLYCWGGSAQLNALLESLGWQRFATPLMVKLLKPARVLTHAPFLRGSGARARLAGLAAASGLAGIGFGTAQALAALVAGAPGPAGAHRHESFGPWSDAVEAAAQTSRDVAACRHAAALDRLMAAPGWPDARIAAVTSAGQTLGWAATRLNRMANDRRFGSLAVGSVLDAQARPGEEATVLTTAARQLADEGADLLVGNVTHARWRRAHAAAGYLEIPGQRDLFLSPPVAELVQAAGIACPDGFHLMPIDGDGPFGL